MTKQISNRQWCYNVVLNFSQDEEWCIASLIIALKKSYYYHFLSEDLVCNLYKGFCFTYLAAGYIQHLFFMWFYEHFIIPLSFLNLLSITVYFYFYTTNSEKVLMYRRENIRRIAEYDLSYKRFTMFRNGCDPAFELYGPSARNSTIKWSIIKMYFLIKYAYVDFDSIGLTGQLLVMTRFFHSPMIGWYSNLRSRIKDFFCCWRLYESTL